MINMDPSFLSCFPIVQRLNQLLSIIYVHIYMSASLLDLEQTTRLDPETSTLAVTRATGQVKVAGKSSPSCRFEGLRNSTGS